SSVFDYVTFFTLLHFFDAWDKPSLFQTGWFVESLLSQTLIVHVLRTGKIPFVQSQASAALSGTTIAICLVGLWLPLSDLAPALSLVRLPHQYLLVLLAILPAYMLLTQLVKTWLIRRFGLSLTFSSRSDAVADKRRLRRRRAQRARRGMCRRVSRTLRAASKST